MLKNLNITWYIIIGLVLCIFYINYKSNAKINAILNDIQSQKKDIVLLSKTVKESDGHYSKLVNNFNTQKEINDILLKSNKDLFNVLKKNDEKLISISNTLLTLKPVKDSGDVLIDSNYINMNIFYPSQKDWFINWNGIIDTKLKKYNGNWLFSKINLTAVLTETKAGFWKSRIVGPEFLIIDSIEVNSLKPELIIDKKPPLFSFYVGGGYRDNILSNNRNLLLSTGVAIKTKNLILLDYSTDNNYSIKYLRNIKN
jgi:hypothetical protein